MKAMAFTFKRAFEFFESLNLPSKGFTNIPFMAEPFWRLAKFRSPVIDHSVKYSFLDCVRLEMYKTRYIRVCAESINSFFPCGDTQIKM